MPLLQRRRWPLIGVAAAIVAFLAIAGAVVAQQRSTNNGLAAIPPAGSTAAGSAGSVHVQISNTAYTAANDLNTRATAGVDCTEASRRADVVAAPNPSGPPSCGTNSVRSSWREPRRTRETDCFSRLTSRGVRGRVFGFRHAPLWRRVPRR